MSQTTVYQYRSIPVKVRLKAEHSALFGGTIRLIEKGEVVAVPATEAVALIALDRAELVEENEGAEAREEHPPCPDVEAPAAGETAASQGS